jgi:hypothetical protein
MAVFGYFGHLKWMCLGFRRSVAVRSHGVPVLAVGRLHCVHGLNFEPVHPEHGPLLVHHVTTEVSEASHQEESYHHDWSGVGRISTLDLANHWMALH